MEIEDKIVLKKEREKTGIILDSYEEWKEKKTKTDFECRLSRMAEIVQRTEVCIMCQLETIRISDLRESILGSDCTTTDQFLSGSWLPACTYPATRRELIFIFPITNKKEKKVS